MSGRSPPRELGFSAAGKLFLAGEYAILWGGVARLLSTGPRAYALVRGREDREVHVLLEEGRLRGVVTELGVRWLDEVQPAFLFVARAIDLACRAAGRVGLGFTVALSPSPRAEGGQKLGLGGSARAAVLATEAARRALEASFDSLRVALAAHAHAQSGKGSGADVACIFAGGLVRYRRYPVEPLLARALRADGLGTALTQAPPVELDRLAPCRIPLAYAFTGKSASTPRLIEAVEERLSAADRDRFVLRSDALGAELERALETDRFSVVEATVEELQRLLSSLGHVETEALGRLLSLAKSHGCVAKVSGAGGGDGVILFAEDESARTAALQAMAERGFLAFPVEPEPGLRTEATVDPRLASWLRA